DEHDLALDDAGVADDRAAGLDDDLGEAIAEMLRHRRHHRGGVTLDAGYAVAIARREAAADIDHAELDLRLGEQREHPRRPPDRPVPLAEIGLLRADMEGDAVGIEPEEPGLAQQLDRHLGGAAELARERPLGAVALDEDAAEDARAGSGAAELLEL